MAEKMTKELYEKLNMASKTLCEYCENDECSCCQVTRLMDDAYAEAATMDKKSNILYWDDMENQCDEFLNNFLAEYAPTAFALDEDARIDISKAILETIVSKCKEYGIEPRRNEIGDYGFVKYDVRKLHNLLYYEGKEHAKEDDPWA